MPEQTDKRDNILQATLRLIVARGLESTPMSLIASQAAVGMGTIYHYFESKEELVNALYRKLKLRVHEAMLDGYAADAPLRQRFFCIWRNLFRFYLANPDLFQFLDQYSLSPVITPESKEAGMQLWQEPIRLFQEGHAQQIFKDMPIHLLMLIANAPLVNLVRGHIEGQVQLDEPAIEAAITACWDAVKL